MDDAAAAHLLGMELPALSLDSTRGGRLDLRELARDALILYVYPRIGRPDRPSPPGWDEVPGARGCTQQSCAFRDRHNEFTTLGYQVVGLSTQSSEDQLEAAARLHLGFPLLSDPELLTARHLHLPTFEAAGMKLYKRLAFVAREGRVSKVFYPVVPPDANAQVVVDWIRSSSREPA